MSRGIEKAHSLLNKPKKRTKVDVFIHIGPTGTGKTFKAFEENGEENVFFK